jgi:hypothetical protein
VSLPHTNWRYVGSSAFTTASLSVVMDAIHSLGTATTYHDNTARTPGSGSAGTWTKVQVSNVTECVYVTPAEAGINHRIMIGGATYTPNPSPTMGVNHTYTANQLYANLVKDAGSFSSWNGSSPFTSGSTMGWWSFWQTSSGTGSVYLWESKDCVAVLVSNSTGSQMFGFIGGAIVDPESDDTTTDAESDGKLYGLITSGVNQIATAFLSSGGFIDHSTSSGIQKSGVFTPGSGTVLVMNSMTRFASAVSTTGMKTRSGRFARSAIVMRSSSPDNCLGRLRDIYAFTDLQVPAKQTDGGSTIGYIYGASASSFADCVLLEH